MPPVVADASRFPSGTTQTAQQNRGPQRDAQKARREGSLKREIRTTDLIATFKDGFAVGWAFKVGEHFRDQLDIKLLLRTRTKPKTGEWTRRSEEDFKKHLETLHGTHGSAYKFIDKTKNGEVVRWRF